MGKEKKFGQRIVKGRTGRKHGPSRQRGRPAPPDVRKAIAAEEEPEAEPESQRSLSLPGDDRHPMASITELCREMAQADYAVASVTASSEFALIELEGMALTLAGQALRLACWLRHPERPYSSYAEEH